jgi:hypothetical protein
MPDPLSLARMRVNRTVPVPLDVTALAALRGAADFAGRQVIDLAGHDGIRVLMLGWPDDFDQGGVFGQESWSTRQAPPSVLLTLAACIRCCWPSPEESPYPGEPAPEERIMAALERFTHADRDSGAPGRGARPAWKSALRFLRACGFLAPDEGNSQVRLGPEIAAWSEADIRQLRDRYGDLPGADGDA